MKTERSPVGTIDPSFNRPYGHARQAKANQALKARCSKAQGGGRAAAETLGWHRKDTSPVRAAQTASPLQGLT